MAILLFKDVILDETAFAGAFRESLEDVMNVATRLSIAIKEKIVSVDYTPYCPSERSGELFNSSQMSVTDADDSPPEGTPVMCTVRLGLEVHQKDIFAQEGQSPTHVVNFRKAEVFTTHCLRSETVHSQTIAPRPGKWL